MKSADTETKEDIAEATMTADMAPAEATIEEVMITTDMIVGAEAMGKSAV